MASASTNELAENNGAYLWIDADDPELLKDVDPARISANAKAAGLSLSNGEKTCPPIK